MGAAQTEREAQARDKERSSRSGRGGRKRGPRPGLGKPIYFPAHSGP